MSHKLLFNNVKNKINVDYVSYIESSGNQYINTNYVPNINSVFEFNYTPLADRSFEFGNSQIKGFRNYDNRYALTVNSVVYYFLIVNITFHI